MGGAGVTVTTATIGGQRHLGCRASRYRHRDHVTVGSRRPCSQQPHGGLYWQGRGAADPQADVSASPEERRPWGGEGAWAWGPEGCPLEE